MSMASAMSAAGLANPKAMRGPCLVVPPTGFEPALPP